MTTTSERCDGGCWSLYGVYVVSEDGRPHSAGRAHRCPKCNGTGVKPVVFQSNEAALLRAILEDPDDDAPRLVYADWLDENERHERAAHIRWAVANQQNSAVCLCLNGHRQPQPCETCQMMGAEVSGIPRRADGETHYVVNRGLVSEVRITTALFLEHAAALFAAHPVVAVRLTDKRPVRQASTYRQVAGYDETWAWFNEIRWGGWGDESNLSYELFLLLADDVGDGLDGVKEYPTEAAALDALSRAAVAHGRALAGLPPLGATAKLETV